MLVVTEEPEVVEARDMLERVLASDPVDIPQPLSAETSPRTTIYQGYGEASITLATTHPFLQPYGNNARSTWGSDRKRPIHRGGRIRPRDFSREVNGIDRMSVFRGSDRE